MLEIIKNTLTDNAILGAIFSSVAIILLGFYLRKKEILNSNASKMLTKLVLTISLPALAFTSFMKDINGEQLKQGMSILVWGFAIYIVFGSTTFFGTPIVTAVYGAVGTMYSNIFNIAYRVFLYSYAFVKMSGTKMDKDNFKKNMKEIFLNPIIIATFLGLFIWLFQEKLPQIAVATADGTTNYAFLRIDQTLPWFYKPLTYLSSLASPLAWISIGATLAEVPFKKTVSQKDAWGYSLIKVLCVPAINFVLLLAVSKLGILPVSFEGMATTVIMMAAPTATVAAAYAISYDRESLFTSNCSLLSTVVAVSAMPILIVILEVIRNIGLFA